MMKFVLATAVVAGMISPVLADSRSIDLQPGFTRGVDGLAPTADRGRVTGYAVPLGPTGGQAGANWTSRSGNFNAGGYVGGDMGGSYHGGVSGGLRF